MNSVALHIAILYGAVVAALAATALTFRRREDAGPSLRDFLHAIWPFA